MKIIWTILLGYFLITSLACKRNQTDSMLEAVAIDESIELYGMKDGSAFTIENVAVNYLIVQQDASFAISVADKPDIRKLKYAFGFDRNYQPKDAADIHLMNLPLPPMVFLNDTGELYINKKGIPLYYWQPKPDQKVVYEVGCQTLIPYLGFKIEEAIPFDLGEFEVKDMNCQSGIRPSLFELECHRVSESQRANGVRDLLHKTYEGLATKYGKSDCYDLSHHLSNLSTIDISNAPMQFYLDPIRFFPQVTKLIMNGKDIPDLSPLVGLKRLQYIEMKNNNRLTDISPLKHLKWLKMIDLSIDGAAVSGVKDLRPLANHEKIDKFITDLDVIDERYCPVYAKSKAIAGFCRSKNQFLNLCQNQNSAELRQIFRALRRASKETECDKMFLNLSSKSRTKLDLSKFALGLDDIEITDIRPLGSLTNLEELVLGDHPVTDLTPLKRLLDLTDLLANQSHILRQKCPKDDHTPVGLKIFCTNLPTSDFETHCRNYYKIAEGEYHTLYSLMVEEQDILTNLGIGLNPSDTDIPKICKAIVSAYEDATEIFFLGDDITDISPLQFLSELTSIYLTDNLIQDLTPLSGLENITELYLDGNSELEVSDLGQLSSLANLETLDIRGTNIKSLEPLKDLLNLNIGLDEVPKEIDILACPYRAKSNSLVELCRSVIPFLNRCFSHGSDDKLVAAIKEKYGTQDCNSIFDELRKATQLTLTGTEDRKYDDIFPLKGLALLEELNLSGNAISTDDIRKVLATLTNLYKLDLSNNNLSFITHIDSLSRSIRELDLSGNPIKNNIDLLGYLTKLTSLKLDNVGLSSQNALLVLEKLSKLNELSLSANKFDTFPKFNQPGNSVIKKLTIANSEEFGTLGGIMVLKNLETLIVNSTSLTAFNGPENDLENLKRLDLKDNKITDIGGIDSLMSNEITINLAKNHLVDITPLNGKTNILELDLSENRELNNWNKVKLKKLKKISISGTKLGVKNTLKWLVVARNLTEIKLNNLSASEGDLRKLTSFIELKRLFLNNNNIKSLANLNHRGLRAIRHFEMKDNPLGQEIAVNNQNCPIGRSVPQFMHDWCSARITDGGGQ